MRICYDLDRHVALANRADAKEQNSLAPLNGRPCSAQTAMVPLARKQRMQMRSCARLRHVQAPVIGRATQHSGRCVARSLTVQCCPAGRREITWRRSWRRWMRSCARPRPTARRASATGAPLKPSSSSSASSQVTSSGAGLDGAVDLPSLGPGLLRAPRRPCMVPRQVGSAVPVSEPVPYPLGKMN